MKIEFNTFITEGPVSTLISFLSRQEVFSYKVEQDTVIMSNKEITLTFPLDKLENKTLPAIKHSLSLISAVFYNRLEEEEILLSANKAEAHNTLETLLGEEPHYYKLPSGFVLCATDQNITENKTNYKSIVVFTPTLNSLNMLIPVYGNFIIAKNNPDDSNVLLDSSLSVIHQCSKFLVKRERDEKS